MTDYTKTVYLYANRIREGAEAICLLTADYEARGAVYEAAKVLLKEHNESPVNWRDDPSVGPHTRVLLYKTEALVALEGALKNAHD